jgi:Kef-type K+ transport system membrane component KefB
VGQFQENGGQQAGQFQFSNVGLVVLFVVAVMLFGRFVGLPLLRYVRPHIAWPSGMIAVVTVMVLIAAAASERLGIHAFLGPFLLGISLAHGAEEKKEAFDVINQFVMSFFVPIYFVSMGLTTNFIRDFDPLLVGAIFLVACVSKIASGYWAGKLSGYDVPMSLAIGCGLNARGAVGVILAGIGLEANVINHTTYVALIVMALGTSIMAGPLMSFFLNRAMRRVAVPAPALGQVPSP